MKKKNYLKIYENWSKTGIFYYFKQDLILIFNYFCTKCMRYLTYFIEYITYLISIASIITSRNRTPCFVPQLLAIGTKPGLIRLNCLLNTAYVEPLPLTKYILALDHVPIRRLSAITKFILLWII